MATYVPAGHPLLPESLRAMDMAALANYADDAEADLGLAGLEFEGTDATRAALAVALWLRCQYGPQDAGGRVIESESKGDQSRTFADAKQVQGNDPCRRAFDLARGLKGAGAGYGTDYATITSLR